MSPLAPKAIDVPFIVIAVLPNLAFSIVASANFALVIVPGGKSSR